MEDSAVSNPNNTTDNIYDTKNYSDESIFSSVHNLSDIESFSTDGSDMIIHYDIDESFAPNAPTSPLDSSIRMVDRSIQLEDDFIATNDWGKQNHWKMLGYEFFVVELLQILVENKVQVRVDIQYSPQEYARMLRELISTLKSSVIKEKAVVCKQWKAIANVKEYNKKIIDMIMQLEYNFINEKREKAYYQRRKNKLEAELEGALAIIDYLEDGKKSDPRLVAEADLQGQVAAADSMISNLEEELVAERSRNESFERKLANVDFWRRYKEEQDRLDNSQDVLQGEDILERILNSSLESSADSSKSLTEEDCYEIVMNCINGLKDSHQARRMEIESLIEAIKADEKEIIRLKAEKTRLNEEVCELAMQVKNSKHLIRIYEEELDPYDRQLREWDEYIEKRREFKADLEGPWSPVLPCLESGFLPGDTSSPKVADICFRGQLPGVPKGYSFLSNPYRLYKREQRPLPPQSPIKPSTADQQTDSRLSQRREAITPQEEQTMSPGGLQSRSSIRAPTIPNQPGASKSPSPRSPIRVSAPRDQIMNWSISPRINSVAPPIQPNQGLFDARQGRRTNDPPPRTPVSFPRSRFSYTDPATEIYNRPPTPDDPSVHQRILLLSPNREEPLVLDVDVQPQPIQQTASGEYLFCNIALNISDPADAHNRVPRPMRRQLFGTRARHEPDATDTGGEMPVTPSTTRNYPSSPLSVLKKRHFSHRNLYGTKKPSATEPKTEKPKLDQSMDWQLVSI